jgi:predicted 3-demethylubiquinone-9 3-methyltransferase (glyoxalase superfamily)
MSKITPCLWFANEAEEAAKFYVSQFPNSQIDHIQRNVGDSPAGPEGSVLMATFTLAGQGFMALNGNSQHEHTHAISLAVDCEDQAEVDRLWDGLVAGGSPVACGWLKDRYGVSWQIIPRVLMEMIADPDPVKSARVMKAMMDMVKIDIAGIKAAYSG